MGNHPSVTFGDSSDFATGRRHFTSWDYGTEGILGEEPQGLITERGRIPATEAAIAALYPEKA